MWRICTAACATVAMFGVAHAQQTMSDEQYMKAAMSAGPPEVARSAAIVRMDQQGMRTLRQGNNEFTCMVLGDGTPMCGDAAAMEWGHALQTHATPPDKTGFMYMLAGDTGTSNTNPYAEKQEPGNHWVKTGPHVMILGPVVKTMAGYPRTADPDPTKPYVMWPDTPYEHLMIPVK
jgi:hypothetical protein